MTNKKGKTEMVATNFKVVLMNDEELNTLEHFIKVFLNCADIDCSICPFHSSGRCMLAELIKVKDIQTETRIQLEIREGIK